MVLAGHAFGIVLLEPRFRGVLDGEYLDVLGIANLLAGVDIDEDSHRWILYALAFFALGVTSGFGFPWFNARTTHDPAYIRKSRPSAAPIRRCSLTWSRGGLAKAALMT